MITPNTNNKEIVENISLLLDQINFRLNVFHEVEKVNFDKKTVELIQDLIIYDLKTIMDDNIFPFL